MPDVTAVTVIIITKEASYKYKIEIKILFKLSIKLLTEKTIYSLYKTFLLRGMRALKSL